jgi:hypothetical protein
MVALTRDLQILTSRVTTRITAILLSISHIAKARYVRTLSRHLTRHLISLHLRFGLQPPSSVVKVEISLLMHAGYQRSTLLLAQDSPGCSGHHWID